MQTKELICSESLPNKISLPNKGRLIVLSGPSGVGKGTLVGSILKRVPNLFYSTSATTRLARPGERDKVDYFFKTKEEFKKDVSAGAFLEWAKVYDDYYGTPLRPIVAALKGGAIVILEIDVQGAMQVKEQLADEAVYIFIAPPSVDELRRRLGERNTEEAAQIDQRLDTAIRELQYKEEYDKVIVNDDLDKAADQLAEALVAARR